MISNQFSWDKDFKPHNGIIGLVRVGLSAISQQRNGGVQTQHHKRCRRFTRKTNWIVPTSDNLLFTVADWRHGPKKFEKIGLIDECLKIVAPFVPNSQPEKLVRKTTVI